LLAFCSCDRRGRTEHSRIAHNVCYALSWKKMGASAATATGIAGFPSALPNYRGKRNAASRLF
jgi:hypothetical protein